MAIGITVGKIAISLLSAFAIVYFRFPFRMLFFWLIFITLMLPVEVRILPTYDVVASLWHAQQLFRPDHPADRLGHGDLPLPPVLPDHPDELVEAARIDRAGPMRFFWDILLPLSAPTSRRSSSSSSSTAGTSISGRFLITTDQDLYTIVMGIQRMVNVGEEVPIWH
jgi:sn-glycerol 3-phosphate transport system permease protein